MTGKKWGRDGERQREGGWQGEELSKQNFTGHGLMVFCHGLHFDFDCLSFHFLYQRASLPNEVTWKTNTAYAASWSLPIVVIAAASDASSSATATAAAAAAGVPIKCNRIPVVSRNTQQLQQETSNGGGKASVEAEPNKPVECIGLTTLSRRFAQIPKNFIVY